MRPVQVDADAAAKAAALRACAQRVIEREEPRRRRRDLDVAMRAMPAGGERENLRVLRGLLLRVRRMTASWPRPSRNAASMASRSRVWLSGETVTRSWITRTMAGSRGTSGG